MELKWEIIEEMNDDDGSPTCWATEIRHEQYGKFCWITMISEDKYAVEILIDKEYITLKEFKTLNGAKRYVERLL